MIGRFISGKFRNPTGFFGLVVGRMMARGNEPEQNWTISLLNIQPTNHVLEIGFGPGIGIQYAAQKATAGFVAGIDPSKTMLQVATKRNAAAIQARRVDLRQGEVSALPLADDSFDRCFTVHCIYFWPKPLEAFAEIRRVLKTSGLLAVTIMPRVEWAKHRPLPPADLFTLYQSDEIANLLAKAGFTNIRSQKHADPAKFPGECVLGMKL